VTSTPSVPDRANRQQERGEGQRVAVDDPQQAAVGGIERERQFLLGNVECGDGGDHRNQCGEHGDEDAPASARVGDHPGWGSLAVEGFGCCVHGDS
jgi:hypothetical protein